MPTKSARVPGWVWLVVRLLVAAAGLGYIAYSVRWEPFVDTSGVTQPGFLGLLGDASLGWLFATLGCMLPVVPLAAWRWWCLLRGVGVGQGYRRVLRLTWMGQFLNYAVPVGSTGGDVARAVVAMRWVRRSQRSAKGVVLKDEPVEQAERVGQGERGGGSGSVLLSLVADRGCGLVGLVALATAAGCTQWDDSISRRVAVVGLAGLGFGGVSLLLYAALGRKASAWLEPVRGWRFIGSVVGCLVDVAEAYRERRFVPVLAGCGLSVLIHACLAMAAVTAALALGVGRVAGLDLELGRVFTAVPVSLAAASIPLTYQGLGVMEWVTVALLGVADDAALTNAVFGMFVIHRLALMAVALPGVWALARSERNVPEREASG